MEKLAALTHFIAVSTTTMISVRAAVTSTLFEDSLQQKSSLELILVLSATARELSKKYPELNVHQGSFNSIFILCMFCKLSLIRFI